jgi:CelD/BcsL family acetyltransferase involved in cellulose biosynthesis
MHIDNNILTLAENAPVLKDGVHVLTTLAQMADQKNLWSGLDRRSSATLVWFQSFDWCYTWMCHNQHSCTPHVLMLVEHGKAVAILPLMLKITPWRAKILLMLGDPHSQYGNLLTETGVLRQHQLKQFETVLAAQGQWDGLVLNHVPTGSALEHLMITARRMERLDNQSMVVDLATHESVESYSKSLSKNTFKNLRRRRKHLEDLGALSFKALRPTDSGFSAAIDNCVAMKQQWLQATGRIGSGLKDESFSEFLKNIGPPVEGKDGPLAFVLSIDKQVVAVELGFLQRGHYYSYMGAFDLALRQHAPGRLQIHETIGWLIEQGAQSMDLLANPTEYKRDVANLSIALSCFARSRTLLGALYVSFWAGWGKPKLKRAFSAIPEPWRAALNTMRKSEYKANA